MSQENLNSSYHESAEENEPGDSTLAEAVVQQRVDQLRDDFDVQYLEYEYQKTSKQEKALLPTALSDILNKLRLDNAERNRTKNLLDKQLHVAKVKSSAEEAMAITQYIGVSESQKDDGNYMMGKQVTDNVDIAYYFPLRNEKNSHFLKSHQNYLEEEYNRMAIKVSLSRSELQMFDNMAQTKFKDIQVIRKRLIELSVLLGQASLGHRKTELLQSISSNIEINTKCKMLMLDRASQRGTSEYIGQRSNLNREAHLRSEFLGQLEREVAEDLLYLDTLKAELREQTSEKQVLGAEAQDLRSRIAELEEIKVLMDQFSKLKTFFDSEKNKEFYMPSMLRSRNRRNYTRKDQAKVFPEEKPRLHMLNTSFNNIDTNSMTPITQPRNLPKSSVLEGNWNIKLVSYRKAKRPKREDRQLNIIEDKIDWFLADLSETPEEFAYKAIALYHLMTAKSGELSNMTLALMHTVNDRKSELEKLLSVHRVLGPALKASKNVLQQPVMDGMELANERDESNIDKRFVQKTHCSIASYSMFISRFQSYLLVLTKRILTQTKRTQQLLKETDELEFFIEMAEKSLGDTSSIKISPKTAIATPTIGRLRHSNSKSWTDLALASSPDAEKLLTAEYIADSLGKNTLLSQLHDLEKQMLITEIMSHRLISIFVSRWLFFMVLDKFCDRRPESNLAVEFFKDLVVHCHKKLMHEFGSKSIFIQKIFSMALRRSSELADTEKPRQSINQQLYGKLTDNLKHQMKKTFEKGRPKQQVEGPEGPKQFEQTKDDFSKKYVLKDSITKSKKLKQSRQSEYQFIVSTLKLEERKSPRHGRTKSITENSGTTEDNSNMLDGSQPHYSLKEMIRRERIGNDMLSLISSNFSKIADIGSKKQKIEHITDKLYNDAAESKVPMRQLLKNTQYLDKLNYMSSKTITGKANFVSYIDYFAQNIEFPKKVAKQVSKFSFDKRQHRSMDIESSKIVDSINSSTSKPRIEIMNTSQDKNFFVKKSLFSKTVLEDVNLSSTFPNLNRSLRSLGVSTPVAVDPEVRRPAFSKLIDADSYTPGDESRYSIPKAKLKVTAGRQSISRSILK